MFSVVEPLENVTVLLIISVPEAFNICQVIDALAFIAAPPEVLTY